MKSREGLIRLKRFHVDECRRRVTQIETMIAEFNRMADELNRQIADEEAKAGIDDISHFAYPTFAKAAMQRRDNLTNSADELSGQLNEAQEALSDAIEELKKVEILEERSQERHRAERNKREQAELDQIGLQMRLSTSA